MSLTLNDPPLPNGTLVEMRSTPPNPADLLVAAVLRDYATLLVLQQSLRTPPQDVHTAYEAVFGSPLDVENLAVALRLHANALDAG